MQPEDAPEIEPRRGLALLFDILVAPRRAYASIAATGEWWPAAVAIATAIAVSVVLEAPAQLHVNALASHAAQPPLRTVFLLFGVNAAVAFLWQVFSWNVIASLYANFCAAGRPAFGLMHRLFFALAANATLPAALGSVALAVAIRIHDPNSFGTQAQLVNALPFSLAVFANPKSPNELSFLSNFDLTTVWSILLAAFGGRAIGGIKLVPALVVPCAITLVWAVITVLPAVFQAP